MSQLFQYKNLTWKILIFREFSLKPIWCVVCIMCIQKNEFYIYRHCTVLKSPSNNNSVIRCNFSLIAGIPKYCNYLNVKTLLLIILYDFTYWTDYNIIILYYKYLLRRIHRCRHHERVIIKTTPYGQLTWEHIGITHD